MANKTENYKGFKIQKSENGNYFEAYFGENLEFKGDYWEIKKAIDNEVKMGYYKI